MEGLSVKYESITINITSTKTAKKKQWFNYFQNEQRISKYETDDPNYIENYSSI